MKKIIFVIAVFCLSGLVAQAEVLTWTKDAFWTGYQQGDGMYLMNAQVIGGETYVVGYDTLHGNTGKVWRQSGSTWVTVGDPGTSYLTDVSGTSATDLWASGNGRITHWNGTSWTTSLTLTGEARRITAVDSQTILSGGGSGATYRRFLTTDSGTTWATETTSLGQIYAVAAASASDMWIGGSGGLDGYTPKLEHYNGTSWTSYSLPYGTGWKIWDIDMAGGEVYVTGYKGEVYKYNSGTDSFVQMSQSWLLVNRGIAVAGDGTAFIVTDRGAIHSYGTATPGVWENQLYLNSSVKDFQGIAINGTKIYAVGEDGLYTATYIPEPATLVLLSLGGLFVAKRRR